MTGCVIYRRVCAFNLDVDKLVKCKYCPLCCRALLLPVFAAIKAHLDEARLSPPGMLIGRPALGLEWSCWSVWSLSGGAHSLREPGPLLEKWTADSFTGVTGLLSRHHQLGAFYLARVQKEEDLSSADTCKTLRLVRGSRWINCNTGEKWEHWIFGLELPLEGPADALADTRILPSPPPPLFPATPSPHHHRRYPRPPRPPHPSPGFDSPASHGGTVQSEQTSSTSCSASLLPEL